MQASLSDKGTTAHKSAWQAIVGWADAHLGVLFMVPGLIVLLLVIAYPIVYNLFFSFTDKSLIYQDFSFTGERNYLLALRDRDFWNAVRVTLVWTAGSVILQLLLGFVAALGLEEIRRMRTLFRVLLIIPWAFPAIVMTFVWRWMVDGLYGVLNYVMLSLGLLDNAISFFGVPQTALATGIAMNVWFGFPFMMVSLLAGLQTIPRDYYEVAIIEGASYLQRLRYVVLPSIKGVVAILVVLRTIWVFNNFDFLYLTTGGGPGNLTQTLPIYAFRIGWLRQQVGRMSAVAILMIIVLVIITILYFRLLKLDDQEGSQ